MKICTLTPTFPSHKGDVRSPFIYRLCKTLIDLGNEVKIVCPDYTTNRRDLDIEESTRRFTYLRPKRLQTLISEGGIFSNLKKNKLSGIQFPFFCFFYLLKALKHTRDCDIIHAHWTLSGFIGVICKKLWRKKLILTTRESILEDLLRNKFFRPIFLYTYRNCDYIASANENHPGIISGMGIPKEKTGTVLNGVDLERFKLRDKNKIREELGLPNDKKIILFTGWLIERKGVTYLFEAAKQVLKNRKDLLFVFVGDGDLMNSLRGETKDSGLEKNVLWVGRKEHEEVPLWLNSADLFVFPSLSEGRPNSVAEAMMCKLPVITTNIKGIIGELVVDGENGLLVPPKDSKAIEESILSIIDNEDELKRIAEEGKRFIDNKTYNWEGCAKKYLSIYENLRSVG
jgi:glycosyltransferase involved in cell wall biosynthesis